MEEKKYLAVDLGATSGRVILATLGADGRLSMETLHRFQTPLEEREGFWWWNLQKIFAEIVTGLGKAAGQKIESIGIDTWGVDFCSLKADGSLNDPRAYRDPYTEGVPEQFFGEMPREELYRRTGIQIMNFNSVFQIYAQKRAGLLEGTRKLLFVPDAISYLLTGNMVCEFTILSTSALMDPRTRTLDEEILKVCGISKDLFPQIVMPGTTVGVLSDGVAEATGLGKVRVVAVAGHDTGSAVAAVPAENRNFAYLSSGTWSLMGIETPAPVIDSVMFNLNFTNEGGADGSTRLLKNITGMWLLEQCLVKWRSEGKDYSYAELARMATSVSSREKLINPDAQEFAAPGDMPGAIREWCRANGIEAPVTDAEMVRLIYDSLAGKYAEVLNKLREVAPFPIEVLHIIGGGSQNELLNQMTADACGVKVVAGPAEGTALGNVMIQAGLSRREIMKSVDTKSYNPRR